MNLPKYSVKKNLWPSSVEIDQGNQNGPLSICKVEDEDAQDDGKDESSSESFSDIEVDELNESDEST